MAVHTNPRQVSGPPPEEEGLPPAEALHALWSSSGTPERADLLKVARLLKDHLPVVEAARDIEKLRLQIEDWVEKGAARTKGLASAKITRVHLRMTLFAGPTKSEAVLDFDPEPPPKKKGQGKKAKKKKGRKAKKRIERKALWRSVRSRRGEHQHTEEYETVLEETHDDFTDRYAALLDALARRRLLEPDPLPGALAYAVVHEFLGIGLKIKDGELVTRKGRPPSIRSLFALLMVAATQGLRMTPLSVKELSLLSAASGFEGPPEQKTGLTRARDDKNHERTWRALLTEAGARWPELAEFMRHDPEADAFFKNVVLAPRN